MRESTTVRIWIGSCAVAFLLATAGHAGAVTQPACTPVSGLQFPLLGEDAYRCYLGSKEDPEKTPVRGGITLTERTDGALYGSLSYDRIGIPIRILGCVDAERRFYLEDIDVSGDVTGRILGSIRPLFSRLKGTWYSGDGKRSYEFDSWRDRDSTAEPPGLACEDWTDLGRVASGDSEPLSDTEASRAERAPLYAFGPFDRAR